MRYVLIPVGDLATVGEVALALEAGGLSDREQDALSGTFERTIHTCELLVTYALGVAGKPSTQ